MAGQLLINFQGTMLQAHHIRKNSNRHVKIVAENYY